jgi:NADPH:quinone reductase-like Zn-dependent oxidoreductase
MLDSLASVHDDGRSCIAGFLEDDWDTGRARAAAEERGIGWTHYASSVIDRDSYGDVMRDIVRGVEEGRYRPNLDRTFALGDIVEAHRYMEANRASGKVVGLPPHAA